MRMELGDVVLPVWMAGALAGTKGCFTLLGTGRALCCCGGGEVFKSGKGKKNTIGKIWCERHRGLW